MFSQDLKILKLHSQSILIFRALLTFDVIGFETVSQLGQRNSEDFCLLQLLFIIILIIFCNLYYIGDDFSDDFCHFCIIFSLLGKSDDIYSLVFIGN